MNSGSIRIHPEHGLNPTLPVCSWCGKETGEIALLGAAYKGEAPRHMIVSDEPCKACQDGMKLGITFIEMKSEDPKAGRTGRWCVMKEEAFIRILNSDPAGEGVKENGLKHRKVYILPETSEVLGLFAEGTAEKEI